MMDHDPVLGTMLLSMREESRAAGAGWGVGQTELPKTGTHAECSSLLRTAKQNICTRKLPGCSHVAVRHRPVSLRWGFPKH
jgi:hypothetical protein